MPAPLTKYNKNVSACLELSSVLWPFKIKISPTQVRSCKAMDSILQRLHYLSTPLSPLHLFAFLLFVITLLSITCPPSKRHRRLPPGPKPWPIIGNIVHLGKQPHVSMSELAKVHGPLISLRLGTKLLVVGSSPTAATQILKTQDRFLSGRCVPKASPVQGHVLDRMGVIWASQCTDNWKSLRSLFRTELFSLKALEQQTCVKEHKVAQMIEFLKSKEGQVVNIGEVVFGTVFNTLSNLFFSKDFISLDDNGVGCGLKSLIWRMMEIGAAPNVSDFYPLLAPLDLQGLRRKMAKCFEGMFVTWEAHIEERRKKRDRDSSRQDFLDVFLSNGFDNNQINWLFLELYSAGSDTTTSTIEWTIAELLKNQEKLHKLQGELSRKFNKNQLKESDVSELPYLSACVKEALRLHPPGPFLLPHRAVETCEVMSYTIPKETQVLVNVWAIGRDPQVWDDPLSFNPERFIESNIDLKGQDYELLPFGAGRRMCPGLPMATRQLHSIIANLVHCFHWSLPNGNDPAKLDMKEKFGITLQKEQPLLCVANTKV